MEGSSPSWGRPDSSGSSVRPRAGAEKPRAQRPPSLAWQPQRAGQQLRRDQNRGLSGGGAQRGAPGARWTGGGAPARQQDPGQRQHRNLKLLMLLHTRPAVPLLPPRTGRITSDWLAGHVMYTLARIHTQSAAQGRSLEQHLRWMRVELMTLPDVLTQTMQTMFDSVQNWLRMLLSLIVVLFLLR